jgi:cyclophilin family peptidyl-prolyl cis-trans isomerase
MGGFYSQTQLPQFSIDQVRNLRSLAPIEGHPAAENPPLSNTLATVSLALSGSPANPDSGSSSFFINLTDNSFLDPQFTVFAAIPDMTVVNKIMALETIDQTTNPNFPDQTGNLGLSDIPVQADGNLVFIKRAFVVTDNLEAARAVAGVQSVMTQSAEAFNNAADLVVPSAASGLSTSASSGLSSNAVPEPASLVMALAGFMGVGLFPRRRRAA